MEAVTNFVPSYNAYDSGIDDKDDELISSILNERRHTLPEEDIKILEKRDELLKTRYHTLQNVNYESISDYQQEYEKDDCALNGDLSLAHCDNERDEALPEFLVDPTVSNENHENETVDNFNSTATNYIHDENVKAQIISLNEQIECNMSKCRKYIAEAKALFLEKMNLQRELRNVDERIINYSAEDAKVKKIKRKKGTDSANTGHMKKTYFCRFGMPYFKSKERFPAYMNEDQREMYRSNQFMMMKMPRVKRFKGLDAQIFDRDVLKHLKAKRIEQLKWRLKLVTQREKEHPDDGGLFDMKKNLQRALEEAENAKSVRETHDWNITPDFDAIVSSSRRFTNDDYKRMWNLMGSSALSRDIFSDEEAAKLKRLVEEHGAQDWDAIAGKLQTNRSGFTCFTKYMVMQKKGTNLPWTPEEDERLRQMCSKLSSMKKAGNRYLWWKNIRRQFPHRSYSQIHAHWTYVLEPSLKKGRFTAEEHDQMERMLKEGKSFVEIAKIVQNRSVVQIRAHFEKPDEEPNRGAWTGDEEKRLLQLIEKYGTRNWVQISKELKTRTRTQCRLKYLMCYRRYRRRNAKSAGEGEKRTVWTAGEEELFRELFRRYGTQFEKIGADMGTKSAAQCRHKYRQWRKKAGVKITLKWRECEVTLFKELLKKYGRDFVKISEEMEAKSVEQCRRKYEQLKEKHRTSRQRRAAGEATKRSPAAEKVRSGRAAAATTTTTRGNWTPEEVRRLAELAEKHGPRFCTISQELKNRSEGQCRRQYQRMMADSAIPARTDVSRNWSLEEATLFDELLERHGRQFKKISADMKNKSVYQCRSWYKKRAAKGGAAAPPSSCANAAAAPATWSEADAKRFAELVGEHGPQFRKISQEMKNKSVHQCRRRYKRTMPTSTDAPRPGTPNRWSPEDTRLYVELLRKHGRQFKKISQEMGNKSRYQCARRYEKMKGELDFELPTSDAGAKRRDRDENAEVGPTADTAARTEVVDDSCENSRSTRPFPEVTFVDVQMVHSSREANRIDVTAKSKKEREERKPKRPDRTKVAANRASPIRRRGKGVRSAVKTKPARKIAEEDAADRFSGFSTLDVIIADTKLEKIREITFCPNIDVNQSPVKKCIAFGLPKTNKMIERKKDSVRDTSEAINDSNGDQRPRKRNVTFRVEKRPRTNAKSQLGGPRKRKNLEQRNSTKKYGTKLPDDFSVANENIENEGSKKSS